MTTKKENFENDPFELQLLHDFIVDRANRDKEFIEWVDSFHIDEAYKQSVINCYLYTEFVLRFRYSIIYDYENNRDVGSEVIDYIDMHKLAKTLTDEKFDEIVGLILLTQKTGINAG